MSFMTPASADKPKSKKITPLLQKWDHRLHPSIRATAWIAGRVLPIMFISAFTPKEDREWTIKSSLILGVEFGACLFIQDFTENVASNTPSHSLLSRGIHWLTNSD